MDPVERRRNQNRMAQRRFRSKKASESVKKVSPGAGSSVASDVNIAASTKFIPYSSVGGNTRTHRSSTTTVLSRGANVLSKSDQKPVLPASADLLSSLSTDVHNMLLPESHDGFSATTSLTGFAHQEPDQIMSLPIHSRSSVAQSASLTNTDDFSYVSPGLNDEMRDSFQLRPDTDMHANLTFTDSPDETFFTQTPGLDSRSNFSLTSDQMTPCSLHDSSEAGSSTGGASRFQVEFCQDCSALRTRPPSHVSMRNISRRSLIVSKGDKGSIPGTSCDSNHRNNDSPTEDYESSLHIAAESGHSDLVAMILRSGSTVDEFDSEGNTPLHRATHGRKLSVVQHLLRHGANPNLMNAAGRTPVHIAVSTGSLEIVETLVRFGGDLNRRARRKSSRIDSKGEGTTET